MNKPVVILAIESSCDETSAAVIRDGKVLSNQIATQSVHERFGGVVPEMASRAHIENIVPVVHAALADSGTTNKDLTAVAFTQAPGLIGSLMVGVCFAKGFAQALELPLISVHHTFPFYVPDGIGRAYADCFVPRFSEHGGSRQYTG